MIVPRKKRLRSARPRSVRRHFKKLGKIWLKEAAPKPVMEVTYDPVSDLTFLQKSEKLTPGGTPDDRLLDLLVPR